VRALNLGIYREHEFLAPTRPQYRRVIADPKCPVSPRRTPRKARDSGD